VDDGPELLGGLGHADRDPVTEVPSRVTRHRETDNGDRLGSSRDSLIESPVALRALNHLASAWLWSGVGEWGELAGACGRVCTTRDLI
jgi:hypothetical protein